MTYEAFVAKTFQKNDRLSAAKTSKGRARLPRSRRA
jgi:hypothetical protein